MKYAQEYWDSVAPSYDEIFPETLIGQLQRSAVWRELDRTFTPGMRILELNCGTGIDAVHLAESGIRVVACDLSPEMIALARARADSAGVSTTVDCRVLPTEEILDLKLPGPFDGVFSNFSGLNCIKDLRKTFQDLSTLVATGAPALFCMMSRYSLWEIAWDLSHGRLARAVSSRATRLKSSGRIRVSVPTLRGIIEAFTPEFRLRSTRAVSFAVPPSSLNAPFSRFPRLMKRLARVDETLGAFPGAHLMADCVLIRLEKT